MPEEIRRLNRRLDIEGAVLLFFDAVAAAFNVWTGQWFLAVLMAITFVVTWRTIAWRRRMYGAWEQIP